MPKKLSKKQILSVEKVKDIQAMLPFMPQVDRIYMENICKIQNRVKEDANDLQEIVESTTLPNSESKQQSVNKAKASKAKSKAKHTNASKPAAVGAKPAAERQKPAAERQSVCKAGAADSKSKLKRMSANKAAAGSANYQSR